jgi:hypothetical protein
MQFLVVAKPQFPLPLEHASSVIEGALAWYERYKSQLEMFGLFPGGGGFGVVAVPDVETLNQMMIEMPFAWFSEHQVYPIVPGRVGLEQLQEAVEVFRDEQVGDIAVR